MGHPLSPASTETLAANRTITAAELELYSIMSFDPGGSARDLTLPAEATSAGHILLISNEADAAEVITIKDDGAATICTPTQNEAAVLWCDGVKWLGGVIASS